MHPVLHPQLVEGFVKHEGTGENQFGLGFELSLGFAADKLRTLRNLLKPQLAHLRIGTIRHY
jgi:hypothetical protein